MKRRSWKNVFLQMILLLISAFCLINAQEQALRGKVDFRFNFLLNELKNKGVASGYVPATIRFSEKPSEKLLMEIERIGVKFLKESDYRLGSKTVFPVALTYNHLSVLCDRPEVASVQPAWRPFHKPPLDVSRPQIQADTVWTKPDPHGRAVTGQGVLIADFDTGVDFFHPMLFFADGDTLNWIDVNANNGFDPGTDAVDMNKNGFADAGETLQYKEITYSGNTSGVYDVNLDFLYNDANNNHTRDYGVGAGYTEQSPTYGEQWFITLDANHDNRLSVGEQLIGLKTSKIRAIRETNGTVRRRGVDLIYASPDDGPYGGHGTSVAGIAVGGVAGMHRLAGIAPGAEMIFASIEYNDTPRFFTTLPAMMAWAQAEGADVMLYEDGEWAWEYLDGSSNEEIMVNEMAEAGIVQVVPAGNLTGGGMQKTLTVNAGDSVVATFTGGSSSQVWPSVRWMGSPGDVDVRLQVNAGEYVTLPGNGSTVTIGGKNVYSDKSVSARGTVMMIISIAASGATTYNLRLVNHSASSRRIDGMLADDGFGWSGLARWSSPSETNTITWPSTADSAIGVAAYKNKSSNTDINSFSGRGTRIDNVGTVVVAAPGSTVYSIGRNVSYTAFGGTSSAGPHVAGAAALLLQADSSLGHSGVKALLQSGAVTDGFTGTVPNTTWGYGKLRILNSILPVITPIGHQTPVTRDFFLHQNYPNPFNPSTVIRYQLAVSREVTLKVYNLLGQEVRTLFKGTQQAGPQHILWDGNDHAGRPVSSGVYIYRIQAGDFSQSRKMILMR